MSFWKHSDKFYKNFWKNRSQLRKAFEDLREAQIGNLDLRERLYLKEHAYNAINEVYEKLKHLSEGATLKSDNVSQKDYTAARMAKKALDNNIPFLNSAGEIREEFLAPAEYLELTHERPKQPESKKEAPEVNIYTPHISSPPPPEIPIEPIAQNEVPPTEKNNMADINPKTGRPYTLEELGRILEESNTQTVRTSNELRAERNLPPIIQQAGPTPGATPNSQTANRISLSSYEQKLAAAWSDYKAGRIDKGREKLTALYSDSKTPNPIKKIASQVVFSFDPKLNLASTIEGYFQANNIDLSNIDQNTGQASAVQNTGPSNNELILDMAQKYRDKDFEGAKKIAHQINANTDRRWSREEMRAAVNVLNSIAGLGNRNIVPPTLDALVKNIPANPPVYRPTEETGVPGAFPYKGEATATTLEEEIPGTGFQKLANVLSSSPLEAKEWFDDLVADPLGARKIAHKLLEKVKDNPHVFNKETTSYLERIAKDIDLGVITPAQETILRRAETEIDSLMVTHPPLAKGVKPTDNTFNKMQDIKDNAKLYYSTDPEVTRKLEDLSSMQTLFNDIKKGISQSVSTPGKLPISAKRIETVAKDFTEKFKGFKIEDLGKGALEGSLDKDIHQLGNPENKGKPLSQEEIQRLTRDMSNILDLSKNADPNTRQLINEALTAFGTRPFEPETRQKAIDALLQTRNVYHDSDILENIRQLEGFKEGEQEAAREKIKRKETNLYNLRAEQGWIPLSKTISDFFKTAPKNMPDEEKAKAIERMLKEHKYDLYHRAENLLMNPDKGYVEPEEKDVLAAETSAEKDSQAKMKALMESDEAYNDFLAEYGKLPKQIIGPPTGDYLTDYVAPFRDPNAEERIKLLEQEMERNWQEAQKKLASYYDKPSSARMHAFQKARDASKQSTLAASLALRNELEQQARREGREFKLDQLTAGTQRANTRLGMQGQQAHQAALLNQFVQYGRGMTQQGINERFRRKLLDRELKNRDIATLIGYTTGQSTPFTPINYNSLPPFQTTYNPQAPGSSILGNVLTRLGGYSLLGQGKQEYKGGGSLSESFLEKKRRELIEGLSSRKHIARGFSDFATAQSMGQGKDPMGDFNRAISAGFAGYDASKQEAQQNLDNIEMLIEQSRQAAQAAQAKQDWEREKLELIEGGKSQRHAALMGLKGQEVGFKGQELGLKEKELELKKEGIQKKLSPEEESLNKMRDIYKGEQVKQVPDINKQIKGVSERNIVISDMEKLIKKASPSIGPVAGVFKPDLLSPAERQVLKSKTITLMRELAKDIKPFSNADAELLLEEIPGIKHKPEAALRIIQDAKKTYTRALKYYQGQKEYIYKDILKQEIPEIYAPQSMETEKPASRLDLSKVPTEELERLLRE